MRNIHLLVLAISSLLGGCATEHSQSAAIEQTVPALHASSTAKKLVLATWNMEHLAFPGASGCKPRQPEEIVAMAEYAKGLKADIVALQEVASEQALQAIFPADSWQIIVSQRPDSKAYECRESGYTSTQQKVAFAVRKALKVHNIQQFDALALDLPGLRYGLVLNVDTPYGRTDILNVHLKSGCFVDDYANSDKEACQILARQVPVLQSWMSQHAAQNKPYVIMGDFNHRLANAENHLAKVIKAQDPNLHLTTQSMVGCHPRYPAPIDHIMLGGMPTTVLSISANSHFYKDMDENGMLSDHCAVSVSLTSAN